MADDFTKDPWVKAPDVAAAFDRARKEPEKEADKPEPKLEYRPPAPAPSPMGEGQVRPAQVSPQLRREEKERAFKAAMLARREFNRAARDAFER